MQERTTAKAVFLLAALSGFAVEGLAQGPPAGGPPAPGGAARPAAPRRPSAYPQRAPGDPVQIARGKALYGVHCNFCHGSDARGGEGGPNLIRTEVVLNDQMGELLAPIVRAGRGEMPAMNLSNEHVADIAAYIHAFPVGGYDVSRMTPLSIVVGNAKAGEAYFGKTCGSCHSVSGDLKAIGGRIADAKQLQQTWLMPGSVRGGFGGGPPLAKVSPTRVTVTTPDGKKTEGLLTRIDDFIVTLTNNDGQRTFTRNGDSPKVEINDPLKPHRDLLGRYTDKDIHDVTAYLVTVK